MEAAAYGRPVDAAGYQDLLRPLFKRRRVILVGGPVAAWTQTCALVRRLGATAVLVVGTEGVGVGPMPDDATWVAAGSNEDNTVLGSIRDGAALVRSPPAEIVDAVEAFDPDRHALMVGSFLNEASELCGRPFLAWRRRAWLALEDKLLADELWDQAGVPRVGSAVVPLEPRALAEADRRLDRGDGTVWAADASQGWHGGAELVRWVRSEDDRAVVRQELSAHCASVRVMPFLAGVPCSIHGVVYPGHVSALRPVEQVSLRRPDSSRFFYTGCATFYDPPEHVRDAMRDAARRVGAHLREAHDYLGAFTIDGIVGDDGFWPTELNPRGGAGLVAMVRALPDIPFQLLLDALVGGVRLAYDPVDLERLVLAEADAHRAGGTWHAVDTRPPEVVSRPLAGGAGGWSWVANDTMANGVVTSGARGRGGFVRLVAVSERTAVGPPFAPAAAAFWAFADTELGTAIGPVEPAVSSAPG